jgi:glycosyltransferase involved in cell wall biosynthesis
MRILVNDQAGHPFPVQLSRALAREGNVVLHTYLANNPTTPKGLLAIQSDDPSTLAIEGIVLNREFKKHDAWARRQADLEYGKLLSRRIRSFKPNVVLSGNMGLDAQRYALKTTHEMGAVFVFWAQDLLGRAIEFGFRKRKLPFAAIVGKYYSYLERRLLCASDAVVPIAPEFCEVLTQWKVPSSRTFVIENWAPLNEVLPVAPDTPLARELNIAGKFCFLYSGQMGIKHKPDLVFELVRHFEERDDVVIGVVAEGGGADWLREHAHFRPGALILLPLQPYERLSEVLGTANVLIGILDADCGGLAVPSKTLSYLCAARPLLLAAPEENLAAKIVRRAVAGEVVDPNSPKAFVAAADRLLTNSAMRALYAENARSYAERNFDINQIAARFLEVIHFALRYPSLTTGSYTRRNGISEA